MVFIRKLYGVLTAPSHDPLGELRAAEGPAASWCSSSLLQPRGLMPGGHCPRGGSSRSRRSLGVKASCALGGPLAPSPSPSAFLPAFPCTAGWGVLWWSRRGLGVPSWWEPLPLPQLSASSPACPAVWPCFASRLLPVLPLTDIVSVGIYISLTTLSPNGIKSKAGDK